MAVIGELAVNVVARTSGLSSGMNRARKEMGLLSSAALGVRRSLMLLGAAFTAFRGISFIAEVTAEAEQAKATFEVLTGSMREGIQVYEQLRTLAAGTPLQLTQLSKSARTLMLFGITAEHVTDTMRMLGDVSGGNATNLQFMARAFGQITSLGRLQAQDLMQLVNAGWNPLNEIMARTGETMEQVRERMKDGKVSAEEVKQALKDATGEGGRFNGMMEKMSKTLSGRWSTLKDQVSQLALQFGEILLPAFEMAINALQRIVLIFMSMPGWVKRLIVIVGALATAIAGIVATVWLIQKAWMAVLIVKQALMVIETFLAGLSGQWQQIALATAAAVAVGGAMVATTMAITSNIDESVEAQKRHNAEIARGNQLMQERIAGGGAGSGAAAYDRGVQQSLDLMANIQARPVQAKLDSGDVDSINSNLIEIRNAVDGTTDAVEGQGGVGMAAGL